MDDSEVEILVRTPIINKNPGTNSYKASGICISGGNPNGPVKKPANPRLNFDITCAMKIAPRATLNPKKQCH